MNHTREVFQRTFRAARRVSTPLIAIRTADPASAMSAIQVNLLSKPEETPVLSWDVLRGLVHLNDAGKAALAQLLGDRDATSVGPAEIYALVTAAPENTVVFIGNAHRFLDHPEVVQGIWNLRDVFKLDGRTLILLCSTGASLPPELANDVFLLDEPLPGADALGDLIRTTFGSADLPDPDEDLVHRATDALIGLPQFPAEQVLAMSLSKKGLDLAQLWDRKRQVVEQTPGLSIWRGGETFHRVGGCQNIRAFLRAVLEGEEAPRAIVFVDEIEKALAGNGTDLSGVKTELTGTMLTWMQDRGAEGVMFLGPAGTAKTLIAKAAGNTAGIPTIAFDLSAMQNSLVGASGERLRAALAVVDAVSQGRSLWIATCNSIASLPPELRRRFKLGTFFFDLPNVEEREAIWRIYMKKWQLQGTLPKDDGWTGAEIEECCRKAWRLRISLEESASYIVPVSRSAADQVESLRRQASGRYLSASYQGVYEYPEQKAVAAPGKRGWLADE